MEKWKKSPLTQDTGKPENQGFRHYSIYGGEILNQGFRRIDEFSGET